MTGIGEGLTDGEAETGTLHKVIDLEEALEDLGLRLLGDAGTRILAVGIQALTLLALNGSGLRTVAQFDIALMGIFHGSGQEVGDNM